MAASENVRIRPVEHADLLEILRIERESFPQPWPYAAFKQFLDEPGFLVATTKSPRNPEQVIGYIVADTVHSHTTHIGHVKDLAIHPAYRTNGVGTRLLERALAVLRTQNAKTVKLEVRETNQPAHALYAKFGFEPRQLKKAYYEDGENALILMKSFE